MFNTVLVMLVCVYVSFGGWVFTRLESRLDDPRLAAKAANNSNCLLPSTFTSNSVADQPWSFVKGEKHRCCYVSLASTEADSMQAFSSPSPSAPHWDSARSTCALRKPRCDKMSLTPAENCENVSDFLHLLRVLRRAVHNHSAGLAGALLQAQHSAHRAPSASGLQLRAQNYQKSNASSQRCSPIFFARTLQAPLMFMPLGVVPNAQQQPPPEEEEEDDEDEDMTTIELSLIFVLYILVGAACSTLVVMSAQNAVLTLVVAAGIFSAMTREQYIDTLFVNFRAITADFVEIVPAAKCVWLPACGEISPYPADCC